MPYSDVLQSSQCNNLWSVKVIVLPVHFFQDKYMYFYFYLSSFFLSVLLHKYINFVLLPALYTYPLMALKGMVAAVVFSVLTLVL